MQPRCRSFFVSFALLYLHRNFAAKSKSSRLGKRNKISSDDYSNFNPDLVFSSALPDVVVNINASEVAIELWDEDEPLCFYSCNLFSFQKQVTVRNLASIIEEYMEKQQF